MIYKSFITFIFFYGMLFTVVAQSPWVEDKGSFYTALTSSTITYANIFNSNGLGEENSFETTDRTFSFYGSYSITDKTAIILDTPFKAVEADGINLSAFGDLKVQVKQELIDGFPLTGFASYTAPTSRREGALRTGFNQHAIDGGLSTGFSKGSSFGYFGTAYRYRSNIPNQVIIDTEIGTKVTIGKNFLYLIFHIDGALNLDEALDPEADQTVLYHNNGSFLSPGIKVGVNVVKNLWLNFGGYGAITATNQGAAPSISLGVAWKHSE